MIIIALGPTATVLAYDLAKEGYQALDMGHFDIEYEWYLRNATKKQLLEEWHKARKDLSKTLDTIDNMEKFNALKNCYLL